ncbi:DUF58 domain-containing protein [Paenibacillus sp. NPDC058071]|uniref:DUF58 domain-containing protein n=1 Tax=Paenibacillus sp. NPDC058071 TaxID=3346326 RepID=UPI0036DE92C2
MLLLWFGIFAILILFVQARLFARYSLRRITYSRHFQKQACFRGEQLELIEQLSNEKWLPVPWLRVESQLSSGLTFKKQDNLDVSSGQLLQNHKSFFTLKPYTKVTRRHKITAAKRGRYRLQSVTLTGSDLLGTRYMTKQLKLDGDGELIVYPLPAEVPVHELPTSSWQGDRSVRRWIVEDPFVVTGARDYRPGDSYKQVNWKATARAGRLQVHQYDFTADRKLMIYLNGEDREGMWRDVTDEALIERGIEWAAGAAQTVLQEGMEAGFCTNLTVEGRVESTMVESRSGGGQLTELLETMAALTLSRTELFSELLEREGRNLAFRQDILVISAYWNDGLQAIADRLRADGHAVAVWQLEPDDVEKAGAAI